MRAFDTCMNKMKKIVLATGNKGKIKEIIHAFSSYSVTLFPQYELGIKEIPETGLSYADNAILKARNAANLTGLPAIGDDSGLEVEALNGEPGIYSARYAGDFATTQANINKLLLKMDGVIQRKARFICTIVYLSNSEDMIPIICKGLWEGSILLKPRGSYGFSYDPIFFVPTHQCSAAELSLTEKNKISHRGKALSKLIEIFHQR